jgi:hypothetical protein
MEDMLRKTANRLIPTAVKTADYTAAPWDLVILDASANPTVTLPTAPEDGVEVGIYWAVSGESYIAVPSGVTVQESAGPVTIAAAVSVLRTFIYIYDAKRNNWMVVQTV